ncbi:Dolichyl-phosphate-mannose-protein mannosyltransferase [Histomonas meleagridis]|uniref:Dolichyl-phosphate-mannose-protein mannosyltransferase n=1 Tax=Histomonas meleagridis TaxID=135588 RepID=UPI00355A4B7B|nr:Dolichyl-phosphate-mannose-protein mannosyltransferase [Histomonas meleagridis]KAH0799951.1 Dolichyl-phosphate-mannose-protein mannosyltransferase [Histomonas meleagridis]
MTISLLTYLQGYKGTEIEHFDRLGRQYSTTETVYVIIRMVPAIFSAFCAPLIYCSCRLLYITPFSSLVASLFVALDTSMIVESKFILSDGVLHFYCALHFFCFSLFIRRGGTVLAILAGITLGMAGSCKFTALGLIAVDGISQIIWIFMAKPTLFEIIIRAIAILMPAFLITYLSWLIHFAITPISGHHGYYIKKEDSHTIADPKKINTYYWGNRVSRSSYLLRFIRWNIVMNGINMRSKIPHPWESNPKYWPYLGDKYVSFYSKPNRRICCMGSPLIYWTTFFGMVITFPSLLFKRAGWQNLLFMLSWAVSYIPFLGVPRTMFHYHYLIPLMFASMNLSALIDRMFRLRSVRGFVCMTLIILCVLCYLYFAPWIYGTECPNCTATRIWWSRWNQGPPRPLLYYGKELFKTKEKRIKLPI